ncbi:PREDICTED: uncharacterized protein LOC105854138 [Condylura cristata]|uniref:uncharacterized protein LOC105854138 n=1 Tax=Condylura cristata TaxID=143302 RepID=UPI0006438A1B|nr:PREDICTED: uncharacterized protein LOC105854138 [Condylura cristata]
MKPFICKVTGVFFSYAAWALGIILARSQSWRMWEFKGSSISMVFIGLWEASYFQTFNISGSLIELPVHAKINQSWVIPEEIRYGQDMILLANTMKSVVLVFGSLALLINWVNSQYAEFLRTYYKLSACFLLVSCASTVSSVIWNFSVDTYGQSTLQFPRHFPVRTEMIVKRHFSYTLPLGITTGSISLVSASLFLSEFCYVKQTAQVRPLEAVPKQLPREAPAFGAGCLEGNPTPTQ